MAHPTVKWTFDLVDTRSLDRIALLDDASDRTLSMQLNKAGSGTFKLPIISDNALLIDPVSTALIVRRNDNPIWGGPIWTVEENLPDGYMSVSAVGWFEILMHRVLTLKSGVQKQYADTDAGEIAHDLLNIANEVAPTLIIPGSLEGSQLRTRKYDRFVVIGTEITNLSEVEAGFDFDIDTVGRALNIYQKLGVDRRNVVLGYRSGPRNLQTFARQKDSSTLVNRMYVQGKGYAVGPIPDEESQQTYGVFEEAAQLTDVVSEDILNAFGVAEVTYRARPRVTYNIVPMPAPPNKPRAIRPFDDYALGDTIYVTAKYGSVNVEGQAVRIFGMDISIDPEGNERVTQLQTAAS